MVCHTNNTVRLVEVADCLCNDKDFHTKYYYVMTKILISISSHNIKFYETQDLQWLYLTVQSRATTPRRLD